MRVSGKKLNPSLELELRQTLSQLLADLKDPIEVNKFLKDFLTETEILIIAKRLAIGYWLKKNRSYNNIKENLKVSSATIAEVASIIQKKGFQLALNKIEAEEWSSQWAEKISKTWPTKLKRFVKI